VKLVGLGQTAVIKSTILPGTTQSIQQENPEIFVMHSPEFLSERTAADDAAHPGRNLVGIPVDNEIYRQKAAQVLASLPPAPVSQVMAAREAELFKYLRNCFFYTKVIFMNLVYDLALKNNCRWEVFREIMSVDPWIGNMHIDPVHKSGRGAGGGCFIKDFAAFAQFYRQLVGDEPGCRLLEAMEQKNIDLLVASGKNLNILAEVYGESAIKK
jgi:UDPglucose 6-dehydrogenase